MKQQRTDTAVKGFRRQDRQKAVEEDEMTVATKARRILDLEKLKEKFPASIKVVSLSVEDYVDHTGDDSLRVQVIIDESVEVERVSGVEVRQLKRAIHDALLARSITEFPYIWIVKQSELDEPLDEE